MNAYRSLLCVLVLLTVTAPVLAQTVQERVGILIDRYIDQRDTEKYAEALQTMLKARDLMPRDAAVWGFLGEAYMNLDRRVESIEAFRKALDLGSQDDFDRDTLVALLQEEASAREEQGLLDAAERLLLEAQRLAPQDADVLCNLGVLQDIHRGDPVGAIRYYQQALALDPACTWARGNLANVLNGLERYAETEKLCRIGLAAGDLDPGDGDWLRCSLIAALVGQAKYDDGEAVDNHIASPWLQGSFGIEMALRAEGMLGESHVDEAIELLCRAARRPYSTPIVPETLAAALRLRSPESDLEALEQQAATLVDADTAAATGACLSRYRVARDAQGRLWRAGTCFGEKQLCVAGDYGEGWRFSPAAYPHDAAQSCALARSPGLSFEAYPAGDAPVEFEWGQAVLGNDLGVSVHPDPAASGWVSASLLPASWYFPPTDGQGRRLLDPQARRLILTLPVTGRGDVRFEWELPLRESRLAPAAWDELAAERRQRLTFVSRQAVADSHQLTLLFRLIADDALDAMPEEARGAARAQLSRHEVVRVWTLAPDQAAAASRLCLLGSHGEQLRGRAATAEELEMLFGPEAWSAECSDPVDTEAGTMAEAIVVFPLAGAGGRPALDDTDGIVRIGLFGPDGRTLAATYEFPRRVQDVPAE